MKVDDIRWSRFIWLTLIYVCTAVIVLYALPVTARETVSTSGGSFRIAWNRSQLVNSGIQVLNQTKDRSGHFDALAMAPKAQLDVIINDHGVYKLIGANLPVRGGYAIRTNKDQIDLDGFTLRYRKGIHPVLDFVNHEGQIPFYADHLMLEYDQNTGSVNISAMDIRLSSWFAKHLSKPILAGELVGTARVTAKIATTQNKPKAVDCPSSKRWPGKKAPNGTYRIDVFMQALVAEITGCHHCSGPGGQGHLKLTPVTILRNNVNNGKKRATVANDPLGISTVLYAADVPWRTKFSHDCPPYNNDQHPFLVWNLYRITPGGALQQVAASGVKHGHVAQNNACLTYPQDNHILGRGCVDIYGTGDNDAPDQLGPRSEIIPYTGQWGRCGSTYDPNCTGHSGEAIAYDGFKYRLLIPEAILRDATSGADSVKYEVEAWYVVRDDVNVYNSMAHRQVTFSWHATNSIWSVNNIGSVHLGPVINQWVNPTTATSMTKNTEIVTPRGRLKLAVRVRQIGRNKFRYQYALMNIDYAHVSLIGIEPNLKVGSTQGLSGFYLNIGNHVAVNDVKFADIDKDDKTDWQFTRNGESMGWLSRGGNDLAWGTLFSFAFTSHRNPGEIQATLADSKGTANVKEYRITTLGPKRPIK